MIMNDNCSMLSLAFHRPVDVIKGSPEKRQNPLERLPNGVAAEGQLRHQLEATSAKGMTVCRKKLIVEQIR
ncbi:hypothetical protein D3C72_1682070 [compost metagenome]